MSVVALAPSPDTQAAWDGRVPPPELRHGWPDPVLLVTAPAVDGWIIRRMLTDLGYAVLAASSGEQAVRIAERLPARVGLLLTDFHLPGMNGLTLRDFIASRRSCVPTLLMFDDTRLLDAFTTDRTRYPPYLRKPFTPEAFVRGFHAATDLHPPPGPQVRLVTRDGQRIPCNRCNRPPTRRYPRPLPQVA